MKPHLWTKICLAALLSLLFASTALASTTYSDYWYQSGDGVWHVYAPNGDTLSNCWFCDNAPEGNGENTWYLIDEHGNMISAGLVQDSSGNYYSLETAHDGYYGKLRWETRTYGDGISLSPCQEHNGHFAAITDPAQIEALKQLYGVKQISVDPGNCLYSASMPSLRKSAGDSPAQPIEQDGIYTFNEKQYVLGESLGQHYLTGYHSKNFTTSGNWPEANYTVAAPSRYLGKTLLVKRVSGARGSEYDGLYVVEDTGGAAVEYGLDRTMGTWVLDIYFNSDEEARYITDPGWTVAEIFLMEPYDGPPVPVRPVPNN